LKDKIADLKKKIELKEIEIDTWKDKKKSDCELLE
jgi:hypothetical protein